MLLVLIVLFLMLDAYLIYITRDPENLTEVKRRYNILREYIQDHHDKVPEKFWVLKNPIVIVGKDSGDLGYNSSKGYEIGLCLSGTPNDVFHVLLHELSHSTVPEYSHSEQFWNNFSELRDIAVSLGVYQMIPEKKAFCGQHIQD
jgi:predicted metal-dependent hydrolase